MEDKLIEKFKGKDVTAEVSLLPDEKPSCKIIGMQSINDISQKVSDALTNAGFEKQAETFRKRLDVCRSYEDLILLITQYVKME